MGFIDSWGWSAHTQTLGFLEQITGSTEPKVVLEFGSGTSTKTIAATLQRIGRGHLWSLDESERFAGQTRREIASNGLSEYATVLHRPLRHQTLDMSTFHCYDISDFPVGCSGIELVFIDGPNSAPIIGNPGSRSGTYPLLKPLLAPNALIILDDADRLTEQRIAEEWERQHQFKILARLGIGRGLIVGKYLNLSNQNGA